MTIYVDDPMPCGGRFDNYCHLWADTDLELHDIAVKLRLPRRWLQVSSGKHGTFKHYDVSPRIRELALIRGARYLPLREWLRQQESKQ